MTYPGINGLLDCIGLVITWSQFTGLRTIFTLTRLQGATHLFELVWNMFMISKVSEELVQNDLLSSWFKIWRTHCSCSWWLIVFSIQKSKVWESSEHSVVGVEISTLTFTSNSISTMWSIFSISISSFLRSVSRSCPLLWT